MSEFLKKYGLNPKELKITIYEKEETFFYKPISYSLAITIANQYDDMIRQLLIIRHCLCEEDGTMVFEEDKDLGEIGQSLPFETVSLLSTKIALQSSPKKRDDQIIKKPVS